MKKVLLSLVLSSLLVPLTANAAAIEITSTSGGVGITNGSDNFTAVASHSTGAAVAGSFTDTWDVVNPAGATASVSTSSGFSAFNVQYSTDGGGSFTSFSPSQNGSSFSFNSAFIAAAFSANSPLKVIFSGVLDGSVASSYNFTVSSGVGAPAPNAVPVPAAVWLFGSALMGLVSVSRRKKDVV